MYRIVPQGWFQGSDFAVVKKVHDCQDGCSCLIGWHRDKQTCVTDKHMKMLTNSLRQHVSKDHWGRLAVTFGDVALRISWDVLYVFVPLGFIWQIIWKHWFNRKWHDAESVLFLIITTGVARLDYKVHQCHKCAHAALQWDAVCDCNVLYQLINNSSK